MLAAVGAVWVAAEGRRSVARRPEGSKTSWRGEVGFRLALVVAAGAAAEVAALTPGARIAPAGVLAWVAIVVFACGVALRLWSFHTLGRYFTVVLATSSDQPVIARGPYRVLRHPSYAALLLIVLGLGAFTGNWLSLAVLASVIGAALVLRIRVEEAALLRDVGEPYRDYAATRKRLVPFLW